MPVRQSMDWVHRVQKVLMGFVVAVAWAGAVAAQDAGQLIAQGDKHLAAYQYGPALQEFQRIPETATLDQLLDKYAGIAMALIGVSNYTEAAPHVARLRELAAQAGTDAARVRALNIEGQHQRGTRTGDRGLSALHEAANIAERTGNRAALPGIYNNLGIAYQEIEDYERQLYYGQKSYDLTPNPSPARQFSLRATRGIAFFEMFDRDAAEVEFKAALDLSALTKRPRDRSFAIGELAYLYWTFDKDAERALRHYDEAIELASTAKVTSLEANWRGNRGNVFRDTGDYDRALEDYRRAIAILEAGGGANQTFHLWKNIGQVRRLQGHTGDAAALLGRLVDERAQDASPRLMWQALMELASAQAANGDRPAARASFERMIEVLERQRKTAILDSYRTGTFAHALSAYDPYERYIKFLLDEHQHVDALHVAERARARGFLEALASVRGSVARQVPARLLAEEARITRSITAAQEKLRSPALDAAGRAALVAELTQAEEARDLFLLNMRIEHPAIAEARYPSMLAPADVQRSLRAGEVAVAFFLSEPDSLRWIVTNNSVRFDRIAGRALIEQQAGALRELLRAPSNAGTLRDAAARLSRALLDGVTLGPDAPLLIVPHGVLHYIPFEVLPLGDRPLVAAHPISYIPSLNSLAQLRQAPRPPTPMRVLAVGNPVVDGPSAVTRGTVENLALLGALPYAERELYAINRALPDRTQVIDGAAARESRLRGAALQRFPIIHFATHGLVSDTQPTRSGLLLSKEAGEDGLLQMSEIYAMGLRADLVVLSACQTALGREITGEGIVGLTRAFFYAGARSVVSALWNLNDRFAAEFVEKFYSEIGLGRSPEQALRITKASFLDHPRYSHPFYWSSMVLSGDGSQPLIAEPIAHPRALPWLASALAFAALVIVVMEFRR